MRLITLTAVGLMLCFQTFATPTNETVLKIRCRYSEIQTNLKKNNYQIRSFNDSESGFVTVAYLKNNRIELIVSESYGEAGKIRHEYYFGKNGELILASNQLFSYQKDDQLTKVRENKYYYQQKKLVRWLENGRVLKTTHPDAKMRSRYMLGNSLALMQQTKQIPNDEIISKHQQNSYTQECSRRQPSEFSTGSD